MLLCELKNTYLALLHCIYIYGCQKYDMLVTSIMKIPRGPNIRLCVIFKIF